MRKCLLIIFFLCLGTVGVTHCPVRPAIVPQWKAPEPPLPPKDPLLLSEVWESEACLHWVDSLMNKMTLKEKVGQLFIFTIAPDITKRNQTLLQEVVTTYKVGGLLFSGGKLQNQAQLTNDAQRMTRVPLMITFDGEWGLAMRLKGTPVFPRNMILGCVQNDTLIYEYGREVARQCRELGVQVNFAPVADVNINPENPVINTRSFGEDPSLVTRKVLAYAAGLEAGQVLAVCKHFPGHGDTEVDSHKALPVLSFSRERMDSVELHPFKEAIRAGIDGMMVGHLEVPIFEQDAGVPSSLSRKVVNNLLVEELGFKGLIFTDALAMKGVSSNPNICLQALKAGNDMVLAPRTIKPEIEAVLEAVKSGELSADEIDRKCRKVLMYKYALGLKKKPVIQLSGLNNRINSAHAQNLIDKLNRAAITILGNKNSILPLNDDGGEIALLEVGGPKAVDALAKEMKKYAAPVRFRLRDKMTANEEKLLCDSLGKYKRIIVVVSEQRLTPYQSFFSHFEVGHPTAFVFFTPAKMMLQIQQAVSGAEAVVVAHSSGDDVQKQTAQILFAKTKADGRLSASLGELFAQGAGVTLSPATPVHIIPEEYGLSSKVLARIDTIALEGVDKGAYPGCQVVVLKDGEVVFDKCYGMQSGLTGAPVKATDMYDLASLTKTTATLLAVMKLYDKGLFNLTDKLSDHLTFLKQTDKKDITIREVLFHQSGLPAGVVFYPEAIDKDSYKGKLFGNRRDATHTLQLEAQFWANPNFRFKKEYVSPVRTGDYTWQVTDSIWVNRSFGKVIQKEIADAPMKDKTYRYSDVGFILLRMFVEKVADMPMDEYLQREFYRPLGLKYTDFLPLRHHPKTAVIPSAIDRFLRKVTLRGFVHDEAAAFQGGVSGNAGLFSTAGEVARVYQMLLNGGELEGHRYLSEETCRLFTTETSRISRRGLGFDKPDSSNPSKSPCAEAAPRTVYGHTGFTGTCAWVDPTNKLVYVFLSNRTYPDATNKKLSQLDIRTRIQGALYDALKK